MICPDSALDCDNPGCRHGGCQGRRPNLPLFRNQTASPVREMPLFEAAGSGGNGMHRMGRRPGAALPGAQSAPMPMSAIPPL
jgi:hypothetical protein